MLFTSINADGIHVKRNYCENKKASRIFFIIIKIINRWKIKKYRQKKYKQKNPYVGKKLVALLDQMP